MTKGTGEMTSHAQHEWERAEQAEAEALHYAEENERLRSEITALKAQVARAHNAGLDEAAAILDARVRFLRGMWPGKQPALLAIGIGEAKRNARAVRTLKTAADGK